MSRIACLAALTLLGAALAAQADDFAAAGPVSAAAPPAPAETATPPAPAETATPPVPAETATPPVPAETATPPVPAETATPPVPAETAPSPVPGSTGGPRRSAGSTYPSDSAGSTGSARSAASAFSTSLTNSAGWGRWFDPATAPFIPVPEVNIDPDSGTTVGIIPVLLDTDENGDIRTIFAPDIYRSQYFGYGAHARVFAYPSVDTQWSLVAGGEQRVESTFDAEYQNDRTRHSRWSLSFSAVYDRNGTPRFYGIGNESPIYDIAGYTIQQKYAQANFGFNINPQWQLTYSTRLRAVEVLPGTITGLPSLQRRFGLLNGIGNNHEMLHRGSITYDTRDDLTVPTSGGQFIVYGGAASRQGFVNDSLYVEAGTDDRYYWPLAHDTVLASHFALRYLPETHQVPFWALSELGGDSSIIGGGQPLRGFGEGRFYDRNSVSASVELRRRVMSFNAVSTHIDLELAPFIDAGRVFSNATTLPLYQLHRVYGLGIRGIAKPYIVGFIDVGYGSEGAAAFTGINYPF